MSAVVTSLARRLRTEGLLLLAVSLVSAAILAWANHDEHRRLGAAEGERLQGQARVIDDNVLRQLEAANAALTSVAHDLRQQAPVVASANSRDKLKLLTEVMPGISSMLVLDHAGSVVASSREALAGRNFSQREYFDAPRRGADPAVLYVSPPFKSTFGKFVLVISRALIDDRGRFMGVVAATLDPEYFNVVLRSVLYAPDMQATLTHAGGTVFLNIQQQATPHAPAVSADRALLHRHQHSGAVASLNISEPGDAGGARLVALRNIARDDLHMNAPLVVAVARELDDVYGPWSDRAWALSLLWAASSAGAAAALLLNQRRRLAAGAAAAELDHERKIATERVELALRGADLGLWDLRLPNDRFVVSARERELLGYGPGDELPAGAAWREQIHPDDRAAVDASIVEHLKGRAPNYQCEHRMRRRDGSYVWLSNRAMIVERDAAGAPLRIVGTHLDITERKHTEDTLQRAAQAVKASEEQMRQVADNMPALVSRFDPQQRLCFVNRAYGDWLGVAPAALLGRSLCEVYGDDAYALFRHHIEAALAGERVVYERDLLTLKGSRRVEVTLVPQPGTVGAVQAVVSVYALIIDVTDRHRAEARLRRLAEIDGLTGLPNRTLFQDRLQAAMRGAAEGRNVALLFVDIDHFKTINDSLGHEAGDQLLKVFARRMQGAVRPSDTVARLGGDEFTVILDSLREPADAATVAGNLVQALREPMVVGGNPLVVTASIGMTLCLPGDADDAAVLKRADDALYEAKRRGRDRYHCHDHGHGHGGDASRQVDGSVPGLGAEVDSEAVL